MTSARDVMMASTYAALARHTEAIGSGTWRVTADNTLVDQILKAADKLVAGALAGSEAARQARYEHAVRPLVDAVRSVRHG